MKDWAALTPAGEQQTSKRPRLVPALTPPNISADEPHNYPHVQRTADCACGGGCPRCQRPAGGQAKFTVSAPGDQAEQEADRTAAQVMRMADGQIAAPSPAPAPTATAQTDEPSGGGQTLAASERAFFEPRFGQDFSGVRLHTDERAAQSARALRASAYTVGQDIVFGPGQFAPATDAGRHLLAHELTHTIQQRQTNAASARHIARQPADKPSAAPTTPTTDAQAADTKEPAKTDAGKPDAAPSDATKQTTDQGIHFGSPGLGHVFDDLVFKLPARWREAYAFGKATKQDVLFDPRLGRQLAYQELMAVVNLFYTPIYMNMSAYKPSFSKALDMSESISGVADTWLNLASLVLHKDLKKYLADELPDQALANLGWTIIYGLTAQGARIGINALSKDDLDLLSVVSKAVTKYTDAPRDFASPYQLPNLPDPRWSSYPFYQGPGTTLAGEPGGLKLKLSGWADPTKATSLSLDLGFNIASAAKLYPEKEEDKLKYKNFEAYPYLSFSVPVKDAPASSPVDPDAMRKRWLAGVFIGGDGLYTSVSGGQKLGADDKVLETYFRAGLLTRDAGPLSMVQASGEYSDRPDAPERLRSRLNAATTIKLVDNDTWAATVGGALGYLLPGGAAAAGGFDYGAQASLYYKSPMGAGQEPAKTGVDLGFTYRHEDPFNILSPELLSVKGTLTIHDVVKLSLVYNQVTGEKMGDMLPKSDFLFSLAPGPGVFRFLTK